MRKKKTRNRFIKARNNALYKNIVLLLFSILLIGAGILIHRAPWKEVKKPIRWGPLIFVLGEGFEPFFEADLNVEFNDLGTIDLSFELSGEEDGPQNAWMVIYEPQISYAWSVEGNIENRHLDGIENYEMLGGFKYDWTTTKTGLIHGENDKVLCFHITVDDDAIPEKVHIQMDEQQAVYHYGDIMEVAVPAVATLTMKFQDIYSMDSFLNSLIENEEELEKQLNEDEIQALVRQTFSAGIIDGTELSPAFSQIYGRYKSEKYYYNGQKYELRQKAPTYGEEYMQYITWSGEMLHFFPAIEYRESRSMASRLAEFVLLALGGFLLPISGEGIYSVFMQHR